MLIDHWPLLGLRVRTARLELRLPNEDELAELAAVAARGVHEPGVRRFLVSWTEGAPAERARALVQSHWRNRGDWTPQSWSLDLVVFVDGRPVGVQDVWAREFPARREVATGSWLGLAYHGRGIGTEMRAAALHLAFAGLGATHATSASFVDNAAPLAVSRKLGYQPDGITRDVRDGEVLVSQRLRLTRENWDRTDRPAVTISGLEPCLDLFGIG
ncbi:GNAT family N-acetyltransferase [Micromonospora sagamiensis]|uniref:RimJ/RimL family protein N-acetyltransferase n=1 Tax=Micromonospora sagamiensis TaxID=47875 RepID=A0A562WND9_9ACTN|nr:GNAT family protein [Micromonospora sagamiensis]TWJ31651.1 RimJ/RimL family protein N-acetyltransferase [Micromonospora sagamiensis]BCL15296.1 putative succinyl-CoA transferase [Micromonospora sagamiensis]